MNIVNTKELAEYLSLSLPTMYRWIREEHIPELPRQGNEHHRFDLDAVLKHLEERYDNKTN